LLGSFRCYWDDDLHVVGFVCQTLKRIRCYWDDDLHVGFVCQTLERMDPRYKINALVILHYSLT